MTAELITKLDSILNTLKNNRDFEGLSIHHVKDALSNNLTLGELKICLDYLIKNNLVYKEVVANKSELLGDSSYDVYQISVVGLKFLASGSFLGERRNKRLNFVKTVLIGLNALGILLFTGLQAYYAYQSSKNTYKIQQETYKQDHNDTLKDYKNSFR